MNSAVDRGFMARAVSLGAQGTRAVRPNPRVGCLLVRDGAVVGEGFHAVVGGPHAEAVALAAAGDRARGATAYVTLEPCNHFGRTPPCAQALIAAGVTRVVIAVADPHPAASGGAETLRAAGVEVVTGVLATAAADLADVFLTSVRHDRAFLQLKSAITVDGRVAAEDGTTRWITGPAARRQVHVWRAEADAILIGGGTALADNPRLDCRDLADPPARLPVRVVLDRRLRLPLDSHLAQTADQATLVVTDRATQVDSPQAVALRQQGVEIALVPPSETWLTDVLRLLLRRGMHHVLCEGGPTLATALWRAQLVDRLDVMVAPKLLGSGTSWLQPLGLTTLDAALPLRWTNLQLLGDDAWLTARPQ